MAKQNRNNFLSPNKIRISIGKFPNLELYAQSFTIPGVSISTNEYATARGRDYFIPGDKIDYQDLTISFIVDEDLKVMREIKDWMDRIVKLEGVNISSESTDITLSMLTNNSNRNIDFMVQGAFPHAISDVAVSVTETEDNVIVGEVQFKIVQYSIEKKE